MNFLLDSNNHLFELARSGKRLPHFMVAVIIGFVIVLAAQLSGGSLALLIVAVLSIRGGELTSDGVMAALNSGDQKAIENALLPTTALEQVLLLILSTAPYFLLLWLWLAAYEKRPLWTIGLEWAGATQKYLRGALVGLLMFVGSIGISGVLGYIAFEQGDPQQQGIAALGGVLLVFLGWTVQGPAEEAVTRGWLLPVIGARYSPLLGVILSSAVFAVFHLLNPNLSLIAVVNLFLFGLFTAFYALYEKSVWGVFGLHAVWNWAQGNLFGFEVSGGLAPGGTLFNLMEIGPDTVTGGPFGPEGGLAVTSVLVFSCIIVWLLGRRKRLQAESL